MKMKTKKVYILLQEYKCFFGNICKWVKGGQYNHASIGVCDSMNEFYSFRSKWGLCVEHPFKFNKDHKKEIKCVIYEIEVSEGQFHSIREQIQQFMEQRNQYHYSYLSVVLGFLGIPHHFKRGYYCSKFVAEILEGTGIIDFDKHSSLYMPCDFERASTAHFEGLAKEFNLSQNFC